MRARGLLAAALVTSGLVAVVPAAHADTVSLSVDVTSGRHAIDPDIYGMNRPDPALATELGLTSDRWGGNAASRYNYTNDVTNTGSDWYFENVHESQSLDAFVAGDLQRHVQPVVTVPMTGWVAKDSPSSHPYACGFKVSTYGAQQATDAQWDPDCGNGVAASGSDITGNDPADTSVAAGPAFVTGMVQHLVASYGDAAHGGIRTYELDNEPTLWSSTHRDVHPQPVTYDELWQKSEATAAAVKAGDAGAAVAGPGDWGWCAYFFSAADKCADGSDSAAHGHVPLAEWYLRQFAAYDAAHQRRLLDYLDEHFYPQETGVALSAAGSAATQALRLRSTRALWDPTYTDESWISDMGMGAVQLIPRMRSWVARDYPGTKLSLSEYNWGGLEAMNGALAEADVLGIFGREGLDRAELWAPPTSDQPGAFAFRIYRDYDGNGARFGDVGVQAASTDQAQLAVYAAQRSADGTTTVVVVNKTSADLTAPLTLSGASAPAAHVYAYTPDDLHAIVRGPDATISGGTVAHTYPHDSITLLEIPGRPATTVTIAVAPATTGYGRSVTVTGTVRPPSGPVAGMAVALQARRAGTTSWTTLTTVRTAADGKVRAVLKPGWSGRLRWSYAGSAAAPAATSRTVAVTVRAVVAATANRARAARNTTVAVRATIRPAHPHALVSLQQRTSSGWHRLATARTTSAGVASFAQHWSTRGTRTLRVTWAGDRDHAGSSSAALTIVIR